MCRITLLLIILMGYTSAGYGQCINTNQYPSDPFSSDNSGYEQTINTCVYTLNDFSAVSNLVIGNSYVFTCVQDEGLANKYITVTDTDNVVIAQGFSPLTAAVTSATVRLHYSENEACDGLEMCCTATVKNILSCPFPTDILISNITTSNASFAWTPGGDETAWQVLVLAEGAPTPTDDMGGAPITNDPEYIHNGLMPALQYNFYVRANCGSEFSPWAGPYSFASGCNPVALVQEGFENVQTPDLPLCWTALIVDAPWAVIETTGNSNSGSNAVQLANGEATSTSTVMLISPNMSTVNTGTHRVKFFARSFNSAPLEIGTVSSTTADGVFTSLQTINATGVYTEFTVDFTDYDGDDTYFAFRHPSPTTYNPVFIDDIRWEVAPLCADVQNIKVASATTTSATITWTGGSETAWDVVFGPESTEDPATLTPISPAPTGEPEAEITSLTPDTTYKVWVRSACGETLGNGAWIGPITFRTPCLPIAAFTENFNSLSYGTLPSCWSAIVEGATVSNDAFVFVTNDGLTGSKGVELSNSDSTTADEIILVSPNLSTLATATHRLKFYARSGGSIEVGTLSSPIGEGNFTMFETIQLTVDYAEYVVDFSTYSGTDTYIGIRHAGAPYIRILLDNLRWELTPACPDVLAITVSDVTSDSAMLSWSYQGSETEWDVALGGPNDSDPAILPLITPSPTGSPELLLAGLTDNTPYTVWVRSACGGTQGDGAWIGPIAFRTACLAAETVNESFETTAPGEVPSCWTALTYGPTIPQYAAVRVVDYDSFTGENSVELWPADAGSNDYVMLVSPALSTLAPATHRLKFRAFTYGNATLSIGTLDGNTSTAVFTPFQQVTVTPTYTEFVINFDTYEGTDSYFALRNTTQNNSVFLDDIRWELLPACPDVTGITYSALTTQGATINWLEEGAEAGFQVAYGNADVTDPTTLTPTSVLTDASYTITGLPADHAFNVWVRSVCSEQDGNGIWMGPMSVRTLCLPATVPYVQNFESADDSNLPACSVIQNLSAANEWEVEDNPGFGFDSNTLVYTYDGSANANVWYFTQGLTLTADTEYTLSYRYGNNSGDNYTEKMKVAYGMSPDDEGMEETLADHPEINTGLPLSNEVTFIPLVSGVYYFGFNAYSNLNQYDLFLDDIEIDTALGTPSAPVSTFSFYPNPVKDVLNLSASENITHIAVYNLLGQTVYTQTADQKSVTVDMSMLSAGSYIVKLSAGNSSKTIKVLKN